MHTKRSFRLSILVLVTAITIMVIAISLNPMELVTFPYTFILNSLMVMLSVLCLFGFINAIKAAKEPSSKRKYFAFAVHSVFLIFFVYVIAMNISDHIAGV